MAWELFDNYNRYLVGGEAYTRVTTIIKSCADAGGLLGWYAKCVAEEVQEAAKRYTEDKDAERLLFALLRDDLKEAPDRQRDAAGDYGKVFHAMAEAFAGGDQSVLDKVELAIERVVATAACKRAKKLKLKNPTSAEVDSWLMKATKADMDALREQSEIHKARFWPDAEAFMDWLDREKPRFIMAEATLLSHTYGYAGTTDGYAELGGEVWMFDYKTSNTVSDDWTYQLAAYRGAEWLVEDNGSLVRPPKAQRAMIVHIKNGKVVPYEFAADKEAFERFASMALIHKHRKTLRPKPIQSFAKLQEVAA